MYFQGNAHHIWPWAGLHSPCPCISYVCFDLMPMFILFVQCWVCEENERSASRLYCCVIEFFYLLSGDGLTPEKADEVFIQWLKSNRESGISVTLPKVKEKVAQLFQTFGTSTIEKTCKWFLLWNNR